MEKTSLIRPSLLAADFLHLKREMDQIVRLPLSMVHFDVMDGCFVEEVSFGEPLYRTLKAAYGRKVDFDVHLMVKDYLRHVELFSGLGAKTITIHYEAVRNFRDVVRLRKRHPELSLGLALSPETDVSRVLSLYDIFDRFLVMSVVPGRGGQAFLPASLEKIRRLDLFRRDNGLSYEIEVDGGVNLQTGRECFRAGADALVCGSAFFRAEDKAEFLRELLSGKEE